MMLPVCSGNGVMSLHDWLQGRGRGPVASPSAMVVLSEAVTFITLNFMTVSVGPRLGSLRPKRGVGQIHHDDLCLLQVPLKSTMTS